MRGPNNAVARAAFVIYDYREMARAGLTYDRNGDLTNPLASREHDDLWETGDGDDVLARVIQTVRGDPSLAIAILDPNVERYVPASVLAVAREGLK